MGGDLLGFRDIKNQVIECIKDGRVQHEIREAEKNLYAKGDLSDEEVIDIIKAAVVMIMKRENTICLI